MFQKSFVSMAAVVAVGLLLASPALSQSQSVSTPRLQTAPSEEQGEVYEWVYRIKYGYQAEWYRIFQKYQIGELDRLKELGIVKDYRVEKAGLHTDENSRWDIRVIITYAPKGSVNIPKKNVAHELFPDNAKRLKDEDRRWELTLNHWDLPIHVIDPHKNPWED
jgi:hypothetical protein